MNWPHGGNIYNISEKLGVNPREIIDFSASINPMGPPEYLRKVIARNIENLKYYPDPHSSKLISAISKHLKVEKSQLIIGNGSTEIIYAITRAISRKRAIIPVPSYNDYDAAARLAGLEVVTLPLSENSDFLLHLSKLAEALRGDEMVFLGQPNNPTGRSIPCDKLMDLVKNFPNTYFIVDESFADFMPEYRSVASWDASNLIMVKSLTKFYAIPGLRLGFGCASKEVAEKIRRYILPWSVNSLAQEIGRIALLDSEYARCTRESVSKLKNELMSMLRDINGLKVFPSEVNFLLIKLKKFHSSSLFERLLQQRIVIRPCDNFCGFPGGGKDFFRVAVRNKDENLKLVEALRHILHGKLSKKQGQKTFSLMLQGTSSNAGKSVLTTALCRILLQDGFRVAPFKAQNMSLNSYVTKDGLEMGRAQVVQAQASRLDPDVRMNPVLLKPSTDVGSQIIIKGRPVANMSVEEYIAFKPKAWDSITSSYDELANEYDGIILEGAGSPGEVNLKHHDIVNMRMARYAQSPVLLVGDIDRGGVFASFIGTMEVLEEWERSLLAGFLVNRFRGNQALLNDAFRYVEDFTGKPVLGLIPNIGNLDLPEEDSVSFKSGLYAPPSPTGEHVVIALIDLPHISNFTDFEPFLLEPDVHLRIIRQVSELELIKDKVAAILLPGSKNVMADLEYLKGCGMAELICFLSASRKVEIAGICGGFQMLGKRIMDPYGIESHGEKIDGLGLLEMITILDKDKTLTRRITVHKPSGLEVYGYEIHHGLSTSQLKPVLSDASGDRICASSEDGMIWGTYLHGIFDADPFRRWFIDRLRLRQGLVPVEKVLALYDLEPAFERLAHVVREGLDMERIYRLLRL